MKGLICGPNLGGSELLGTQGTEPAAQHLYHQYHHTSKLQSWSKAWEWREPVGFLEEAGAVSWALRGAADGGLLHGHHDCPHDAHITPQSNKSKGEV